MAEEPGITIAELVSNGTLTADMAAVLWAAADEQVGFLTVAVPRFAGKSTLSNAVLALRPSSAAVRTVAGEPDVMDEVVRERAGGYLVVAELSRAPVPGYIWGEKVRRVFEAARDGGYSLQTALHAGGVAEGMLQVTEGNGVSDELASLFGLVLYIERLGTEPDFTRRLAEVFEVDEVRDGRPVGRTLFRWHPDGDRFEKVSEPEGFGKDREALARRAELIGGLAASGRTSPPEVQAAVVSFAR